MNSNIHVEVVYVIVEYFNNIYHDDNTVKALTVLNRKNWSIIFGNFIFLISTVNNIIIIIANNVIKSVVNDVCLSVQ